MAKRSPWFHLAGMTATALGAGWAAARVVVFTDRRRDASADVAELSETDGAVHHVIDAYDGGRLHVLEAGNPDARPLVLLHGVVLSSRVWAYQMADLGDRFRILAPDWRGHGRSVAGAQGYGLDRLGHDLATILERLDLHDAILVGHSMGGMGLMRCAADHPEVLRHHAAGLVFQSTAASDTATGPVSQLFRTANMAMRNEPVLVDHVPVTAPGNVGYTLIRLAFGKQPAAAWVEETRAMLASMSSSAAGRSVLALMDHDCRTSLPSVGLPTLVLVGSNDLLTPEAQSRQIAALIPGAHLTVFPGAGHMLMYERRAELADALVTFADRLPAPRARARD